MEPATLRIHRMKQFMRKMVDHHDSMDAIRTMPVSNDVERQARITAVANWHTADTALWEDARNWAGVAPKIDWDEGEEIA